MMCVCACVLGPVCFSLQIHGNVRHRAVVVTATLDWKLHGFDLCSEHDKVDEEGTLQVTRPRRRERRAGPRPTTYCAVTLILLARMIYFPSARVVVTVLIVADASGCPFIVVDDSI